MLGVQFLSLFVVADDDHKDYLLDHIMKSHQWHHLVLSYQTIPLFASLDSEYNSNQTQSQKCFLLRVPYSVSDTVSQIMQARWGNMPQNIFIFIQSVIYIRSVMLIVLNWSFNFLEQLFSCTLHKTYVIPSHVTLLGLITKITDDSMLSDITIRLSANYFWVLKRFLNDCGIK